MAARSEAELPGVLAHGMQHLPRRTSFGRQAGRKSRICHRSRSFSPADGPVGMQLIGARGRDETVLSLAIAFQAVTDFHRKPPPLS